MPTYEYECSKCKSRFEIKRGFHEEGGGCCPQCGGEGRQIYSPTPIIFKGSGFYVTDHKKKDDKATDREPSVKTEAEKPAKKSESTEAKAKPVVEAPVAKTEPAKTPPKSDTGKP